MRTAPLPGQVATVRVEENFRAEPNGTIVARVRPGARLPVARVRGNWVETELEGWVWAPSLGVAGTGGLDRIVSVAGGENLRSEPQGSIRARLVGGALLDELGRRPGWVHVRRVGWIWQESVRLDEDGEEPHAAAAGGATVESPPVEPAEPSDGILGVPEGGLAVLSTPDGDTLARAQPGRDLAVVGREGAWARVRLEGWVWLGAASARATDSVTSAGMIDPESVIREPDRYRGRIVTWPLQFVSLETAERLRTDFYEGEPFLLTRLPGGGGTFVYVAVPPDRLGELEDLVPLEPVQVVGRIRTGSSALTGSPILDLVDIRRLEGR